MAGGRRLGDRVERTSTLLETLRACSKRPASAYSLSSSAECRIGQARAWSSQGLVIRIAPDLRIQQRLQIQVLA